MWFYKKAVRKKLRWICTASRLAWFERRKWLSLHASAWRNTTRSERSGWAFDDWNGLICRGRLNHYYTNVSTPSVFCNVWQNKICFLTIYLTKAVSKHGDCLETAFYWGGVSNFSKTFSAPIHCPKFGLRWCKCPLECRWFLLPIWAMFSTNCLVNWRF